jgi:S-adenosylmethionine:tRNA ribosyltransferase-isomerase
MDVAAFDFELPDELIAQEPSAERGESRLLVVERTTDQLRDANFSALPEFLTPGDLLVLNNTRVFPARLLGRRAPSGGAVECLLLRQHPAANAQLPRATDSSSNERNDPSITPDLIESRPVGSGGSAFGSRELGVGNSSSESWALDIGSSQLWEALVHPGQKLKPGAHVLFEASGTVLHGEVLGRHFHGRRTVRLWRDDGGTVNEAIDRLGHIPLPPYIKRDDAGSDRERYQTVYARHRGSVAAPTAGLHFTAPLLDQLAARGVERTEITLHVGYGTFKPVRVDRVEDHVVDAEVFTVSADAAGALTRALQENRRVVAVGTTTTRALESLTVDADRCVHPRTGTTQLFIHPGHRFAIVGGLVTNFHLPRSSLLMLVAAFAGRDRVLAAYRHAIAERYRFYSYGDAMLLV